MDRYAKIVDGLVIQVIESEFDPDGINGEWVYCPPSIGPGWLHNGTHYVQPPEPETPTDEAEWYIDLGPFNDRFGAKKLQILASQDAVIQAFNKDKDNRHWIDLKRSDVAAALGYMAGMPLPGLGAMATPILTMEEVQAILTTPVTPQEQMVLRKMYFK